VLSFFSAFLICLVLTPFLIRFAAHRKWFDVPDQRKLHEEEIPRLGGVAIAGAFLISIFLSAEPSILFNYRYFFAGLLMLFFVGVWDDLQPVKPWVKLAGELLPIALLAMNVQVDFSAIHPAFGGLSFLSFAITLLAAFWMVNAFNLIDGINGLAGTIGFIAFTVSAFIVPEAAPLCFSMAGALLAFLFYNVRNPRIFMGDSGSLLLGYCMVFVSTLKPLAEFALPSWLIVLPLVSVPLFDMARVFVVRIAKGHHPFRADRNHLHHLLLETGCSHIKATGQLAALTILTAMAAWAILIQSLNALWILLVCSAIPLLFTLILWLKVSRIRKSHKEVNPGDNAILPNVQQ